MELSTSSLSLAVVPSDDDEAEETRTQRERQGRVHRYGIGERNKRGGRMAALAKKN